MLWLRLPHAADALQEKGGGEAGAEHMASSECDDYIADFFLLFVHVAFQDIHRCR